MHAPHNRWNESQIASVLLGVWSRLAIVCCLVVTLSAPPALAASYGWCGKGDGHSWSDPYNWDTASHLHYPGYLPCEDSASIPTGFDVDVDVDVHVGKLEIASGSSVTVQSVVLAFMTLTGCGTLINFGTVTPCGSDACISETTILRDSSGANWIVDCGQNMTFGGSATSLHGDFVVASIYGSFTLGGSSVMIYTTGHYVYPTGSIRCDLIHGASGSEFVWTGGSWGVCRP